MPETYSRAFSSFGHNPNYLQEKLCIAAKSLRDSFFDLSFNDVVDVSVPEIGNVPVPVIKGDLRLLPSNVQIFIAEHVALCRPRGVFICDGGDSEMEEIKDKMVARGMLTKLNKMDNWCAL